MSVWTSAFMSHPWAGFSEQLIENLARAISPDTEEPGWRLISESGSAARDFEMGGEVKFRVSNVFSLHFANKILLLGNQDRWGATLSDRNVREAFLELCQRVAGVTGSKELLLLPEGTVLNDSLYDNISFDELKSRANKIWGGADLDIHRVYTEAEIREFDARRVHYFLLNLFPKMIEDNKSRPS